MNYLTDSKTPPNLAKMSYLLICVSMMSLNGCAGMESKSSAGTAEIIDSGAGTRDRKVLEASGMHVVGNRAVFDPAFEEFFVSDPLLIDGHTRVVEGSNGRYIIAPGSTGTEGKQKSTMQRVAEVTARRNLAAFLEVRISSEIVVVSEESDEGSHESVKMVVIETTEQFVRKAQTVGRWYSNDEKEYYVAVAVAIPGTFSEENQ